MISGDNLRFIPCDRCGGFGRLVSSHGEVQCSKCHGIGVYAAFEDQILFWGKPMNVIAIAERKMERGVRMVIDGGLTFFLAVGLGWGLFEIIKILPDLSSFTELLNLKRRGLALFWVSALGGLWMMYRMDLEMFRSEAIPRSRDHARKRKIEVKTFEEAIALPKKETFDISRTFSEGASKVLEESWRLADKLHHRDVAPIHLLASLLAVKEVSIIFSRLGIPLKVLSEKVTRSLKKEHEEQKGETGFSPDFYELLFLAYDEARKQRRRKVDVLTLLVVVAKTHRRAQEILFDLGVDDNKLRNVVAWLQIHERLRNQWQRFRARAHLKPKGIMNRAMTARPTTLLDRFSRDLTLAARAGSLFPLIDREKEVGEALRILEERLGNVLLVGDSGVGKTIIGEGIAERMTAEDVPEVLQDKRLVSLDTGALVGGAGVRGAIEERVVEIVNEVSVAGNVVLFIDDVANLVGQSSAGGAQDAASILSNALSQGLLKMIGAVTTQDFNLYLKNNDALMRRFQVVDVPEMDDNAAIQVLEGRAGGIEYRHKVFFSYDAIENAVKLSRRYIHDRYLPAKALDLIEEAAVLAKEQKGKDAIVTKEDIAEIMAEKTNIKVTTITREERDVLLHLEERIHERIVGQDEAVAMIAEALRRARVELRDMKRPIANFLFLGPTGVGKTELAKTVAEVYFGSETNMIRLDMSEYQDSVSLDRLIGAPTGLKGTSAGGYLTEAVRSSPFSLILLDELEKAHPDLLNVFLQVMDDGRLTDGVGRTIDFTNVILIATSNAGTLSIQEGLRQGLSLDRIKQKLFDETLQKYFRPEFLNRFDGIVIFKPLDFEEVVAITHLELKKVARQLESRGITLRAEEEAIRELAQTGFHPELGARPLRRVIQNQVDSALANYLLIGAIGRRDIAVLEAGGVIRIQKAERL